jgi:hypothetical protein
MSDTATKSNNDDTATKQVGSLGTLRLLSPTIAFLLVSFSLGELVSQDTNICICGLDRSVGVGLH